MAGCNNWHRNIVVPVMLTWMGLTGISAQSISVTAVDVPYVQDFNTLGTTPPPGSNATMPPGWYFQELGAGANTMYSASNGSHNTADTYSYGPTGFPERALGELTDIPATIFGAQFTNNTGVTVISLLIQYTGEQWRLGAIGLSDSLTFQYSTNALSLTTGTWETVGDLSFTGPVTGGAANSALNGNLPQNKTLRGGILTGLSITTGASFWIRWVANNAAGNDHGLAVDDFLLSANPALHYSITTTGGNLVFTDDAGTSTPMDITQEGTNIRITSTGRTYSLNGGPMLPMPVDIPLAPLQSITINAGNGNDEINFGTFSTSLPSLTINGDNGNDVININGDINFISDAHFDANLQNDVAFPGTDLFIMGSDANITLSGAGSAIVRVSRNILFNSGSGITTVNGHLTVEANQQTTPATGTFVGVEVIGATVASTGSGIVIVNGRGGTSGNNQYGVYVRNAGLISGGATGTSIVQGTGGMSNGGSNQGVVVAGSNSRISTNGSHLTVDGQGGEGNTGVHHGIMVDNGGSIKPGGLGNSNVFGRGGFSGNANNGVTVSAAGSIISSTGGNVTITGEGGGGPGNLPQNFGVFVTQTGMITAEGTGTVTILGTGGVSSGASNYGVIVNGTGSEITSSGGAVLVTGIEGSGASGIGIIAQNSGSITTSSHGGNITCAANSIQIFPAGTIITPASGVTSIVPFTPGTLINLGPATDPIGGPLHLSDAELDLVTTGTLIIGDAQSGAITVSSDITCPASTNVQLISGSDVVIGAGVINTAGGDLLLHPGNSPAAVKPLFPGTDVICGTLFFGSDLSVQINGTSPGDGTGSTYTQLTVEGAVDLTGVDLMLSGSYIPTKGDTFVIVNNDGVDPITGTFNGLPEGSVFPSFLGSAYWAAITYTGGTGNDVVIRVGVPHYIVDTTGGHLVITDVAGNSNSMGVSQEGAALRFSMHPSLRYSLNGMPLAAFPLDIAMAGLQSITINAGEGDDFVSFGPFSLLMPSLTVNGGKGQDAINFEGNITFFEDAFLDLNLQNDDPVPGDDYVFIAPFANLTLSGNGDVVIDISGYMSIIQNGSITTENGDLTIIANMQPVPVAGTFPGFELGFNSTLQITGTGDLTVKAKGGNGSSGPQDGIRFNFGSLISGGLAGSTTHIEGYGGSASGSATSNGVYVPFNGAVSSTGGDVYVYGTGGIGSGEQYGVLLSIASLSAGGMGNVYVEGTAGSAGGSSSGVFVFGTGAIITSAGGDVSVTGYGMGSVNSMNNLGVHVIGGGMITAGGNGEVSVTGHGATNIFTGFNDGVRITGAGSLITSSGGDITVTGQGGGGGQLSSANFGVSVVSGGGIEAIGNGRIFITGTGGDSPEFPLQFGVAIQDAGSHISSLHGDIEVHGQGGGTDTSFQNMGVVLSEGYISAFGNGNVLIDGTGGPGKGHFNSGVYVTGQGQVNTSGGHIQVTGQGGGIVASFGNSGVHIDDGILAVNGEGNIIIEGTGGTSTGGSNLGVRINNGSSSVTTTNGNIEIYGLGGGTGTSGSNIGVQFSSGANIHAGNSGSILIEGAGGETGGSFNFGVVVESAARVTSAGGMIEVVGTGGGSGTSSSNKGIFITGIGEIMAENNGAIVLTGSGGSSAGTFNTGVEIEGTSSLVTSSGGNIQVTGIEGGGTTGIGISIVSGAGVVTIGNNSQIDLVANSIDIGPSSGVSTSGFPGSRVVIRPNTPGVLVDLGVTGDPIGGPLQLADTELDQVFTRTLVIGDENSGAITVTADITRPSTTDMRLMSIGDVVIGNGVINTAGGNLLLHPGDSPAAVKPIKTDTDVICGELSFGSDLAIVINGTTPGDGSGSTHTQLAVIGTIDLTGVTLVPDGNFDFDGDEELLIVDNDGTDAITGTFVGMPEGFIITNFLGSGFDAEITYTGGNGNDVVLKLTGTADYLITTTGEHLVITDISGNSETLSASQNGAAIRFHANGRTARINTGPVAAMPTDVTLAGVQSVTINTATGHDTLNIGSFTTALPHLTINGGTGDDIVNLNSSFNIAHNTHLDIDLQNDDDVPGADRVIMAAGAIIFLTGSSSATIRASRNVVINGGARIETIDGHLVIEANQRPDPTPGNFAGIDINGGVLRSTGTGQVSVKGKGGNTGAGQFGIQVRNGGDIIGGTSGNLAIEGHGGVSTAAQNIGVMIFGAGTTISSAGSDVQITGTGGGDGATASNLGVFIHTGAHVSAGSTGEVHITGISGLTSGNGNNGVFITGPGTMISTFSDDIHITGEGRGTGASSNSSGLVISGNAAIVVNNTGQIFLEGSGGQGTGELNTGIITDGITLTTADGDIMITGYGGGTGSGNNNYGATIFNGTTITSGDGGNIVIEGAGGASSGSANNGVRLQNNPVITSSGNITITGIEGQGTLGAGISHTAGGSITTTPDGNDITLIANSMNLLANVSTAPAGHVSLLPYDNDIPFELGTVGDPRGGPVRLTDIELDFIATGTLVIGNHDAGTITVTADITRPSATDMLLISIGDVVIGDGVINTAGGDLLLNPGDTPAAVKPIKAGTDVVCGTLSFGSDLAILINGITPGDGSGSTHTQLAVIGAIDLAGVTLVLSGSYIPTVGDSFVIVLNDGIDPVTGIFNGLPEGHIIPNFPGSGPDAQITYAGGDGNDVVIRIRCSLFSTLHVDANAVVSGDGSTWASAFKTPGEALAIANDCQDIQTILIAEGTYYPTGEQSGMNRDSAFAILRGGIALYGGYDASTGLRDIIAHPTLLSGDIGEPDDNTDNSFHVIVIAGTTGNVIIDGLSIAHGHANGAGSVIYNGHPVFRNTGDGLYSVENELVVVENVKL